MALLGLEWVVALKRKFSPYIFRAHGWPGVRDAIIPEA